MLMSEVVDKTLSENEIASPDSNPGTPSVEVYAVYGVEPEIQAYAMAKYSRSALSMKESLREISTQKAEKFLNTFYFQYGHRSIADLAHIALAIEQSRTNSAGTVRSAPPAIRISRRAATICPTSATIVVRATCIAARLISCSLNTKRCRTACSCTWSASLRSQMR
jgi:hypothetical protein